MKLVLLTTAPFDTTYSSGGGYFWVAHADSTDLIINEGSKSYNVVSPVQRDADTLAVQSVSIQSSITTIDDCSGFAFDGSVAFGFFTTVGFPGPMAFTLPLSLAGRHFIGVLTNDPDVAQLDVDGTYVYLFTDGHPAGQAGLNALTFVGTTWTPVSSLTIGAVTPTFFGHHNGYLWTGIDNTVQVWDFNGAVFSNLDTAPLDTTPWYSFTAYGGTVFVRTLNTIYALEYSGGSINILGTLASAVGTPPPSTSEWHFPRQTLYFDGTYLYVLRITGPDDATRTGYTDIYEYSGGTFTPVLTYTHTPFYPGAVGGGNGYIYGSNHTPDEYGPFNIFTNRYVLTSADFSASTTSGKRDLSVTFTALGEGIASYSWDFGDGDTSTDANPTHVYDTPGTYTVSLSVVFDDSQTDSETKTDYIEVFPAVSPVLNSVVDNLDGTFTASWGYYSDLPSTESLPVGLTTNRFIPPPGDRGQPVSYEPGTYDDVVEVTWGGTDLTWYLDTNESTASSDNVEGYELTSSIGVSVRVQGISYFQAGPMICIGWVRDPGVEDGNMLIPLAVADPNGNVLDTDRAMRFEIHREGNDYRLGFMTSRSQLIDRFGKIKLNDGAWHFIMYQCLGEGTMLFRIDDTVIQAQSGVGDEGLSYDIAASSSSRVGGGKVWAPYLTERRQALRLYNWRYKSGLNLHADWVSQLITRDKISLGIL